MKCLGGFLRKLKGTHPYKACSELIEKVRPTEKERLSEYM